MTGVGRATTGIASDPGFTVRRSEAAEDTGDGTDHSRQGLSRRVG